MFCRFGLVAGQPPGHGHGLRVVRVHAAGARMRHLRQLVGVGALELRQAPVLQQLGRQRIVLGQLLQHLLVGAGDAAGRLLHHRQAELGEQDLADLLGRAQVEGLAREVVRLLLELHHALAQLGALPGQDRAVDQHAVALDAVQRLAAAHLQVVDEAQFAVGLQPRPQRQVHVQRLVRILAGIFGGLVDRHLRERDLVRALAGDGFVVDAAAPQVALGQAGQAVRLVHFEHVALQHGVVRVALHFDAVVGEHVAVVLDVLAQLGLGRVLQPGLQAAPAPRRAATARARRRSCAPAECRRPRRA